MYNIFVGVLTAVVTALLTAAVADIAHSTAHRNIEKSCRDFGKVELASKTWIKCEVLK